MKYQLKEVKKNYQRLNIIRAIACILVLLYHLNILKGGFLAVCTFLTLSGYLRCLSLLEKENFSIKKYYIKRIKRLYLPLIIVIFLTLIMALIINPNWLNFKNETISALLGYNNFWQIDASLNYFTKHINSPFIHLWYISILMQFDLIFPIIFLLMKKLNNKINKNMSTFLVVLLLIFTTGYFYYLSTYENIMIGYYNTLARSFSIISGILLAMLHYKYNFNLSNLFKKYNTLIFTIYNIILITLCIFVSATDKNYAIYMIITTIISLRLIEYSKYKNNSLENKLISFIARNSYEIYLVQYPVIFFIQDIKMNNIVIIFIIISLTLIIALVVHQFINYSPKNILLKILKSVIIAIIAAFGIYTLITKDDHQVEMRELENKLDENLKIIEQRNQEYLNNLNIEEEQLQKELENMELEKEDIANIVSNLPVVGIGDSVLLGAIDGLYAKFPNGYFDGKVSRTIVQAEDILIDLKNQGKLPDTLILALANNGDYSDYINRGLMEIIGNREVYWVTAVLADDPEFNDKFRVFAKNYPNIHIVEWEEASKNHPEYFYADGIHVKQEGVPAYASVIYDTIYNQYLIQYENKRQEKIREHQNEIKNNIAFYGNDILIESYDELYNKFEKIVVNAKDDYSEEDIINDLKNKIENNTLEHKIVLLFDKTIDYQKIIDILSNYEVYIVNIYSSNLKIDNENVKIINFYEELKQHSNYLKANKISLSNEGIKALINFVYQEINI